MQKQLSQNFGIINLTKIYRISICHLPFQSKWLYIGTERGNVQIVNLESFTLSGYIINWNKAMDLLAGFTSISFNKDSN